MNEKQRKKAVKELKIKIIPKIKATNLANNPDKNLSGQGVYDAKAIFTSFDFGMGKNLGDKINIFREDVRKWGRTDETLVLANDIKNYIIEKTAEMERYPPIKKINKTENHPNNLLYYLKDHPKSAALIILVMLLASILGIISFVL